MGQLPPIVNGEETYLGDGLYASFDPCRMQYRLRAPREHRDHEVFLDAAMLVALHKFVGRVVVALARCQDDQRRSPPA